MKLVIAIVQASDADEILDALVEKSINATQITSAGGFLREPNVTLLIGVDDAAVHTVIDIVDRNSNARRMFVNPLMPMAPIPESEHFRGDTTLVRVGASVFVVDVERFFRLTE